MDVAPTRNDQIVAKLVPARFNGLLVWIPLDRLAIRARA